MFERFKNIGDLIHSNINIRDALVNVRYMYIMADVPSQTTFYTEGGTVIKGLIVRNIYALKDETDTDQDLRIGATNDVVFSANSVDALKISNSISGTQMQAMGDKPLHILASDSFNTVRVSGIETSTNISEGTNYIASVQNYLAINTDTLTVNGSTHIKGDLLCDSAFTANKLSIVRSFADNRDIGFGFSVNESEQLVIYKFDSSQNTIKTVNVFGGTASSLVTDHYVTHSVPTFGNALKFGTPVNNLTVSQLADNDPGGLWTVVSGTNDIYYLSGNVGIGTNTPESALDVSGTANISGDAIIRGSVGVGGISTPTQSLDVSGNAAVSGVVYFQELHCSGANNIIVTGNSIKNVSELSNSDNNPVTLLGEVVIANGSLVVSNGSVTASMISDGDGTTISGGTISAKTFSDGSGSIITGGIVQATTITDGAGASLTGGIIEAITITDGVGVISNGNITTTGYIKTNVMDTSSGDIVVSSDIIPNTTESFNIGTPDMPFQHIYCKEGHFGENTVYIGDVSLSIVDNTLVVNGAMRATAGIGTSDGDIHSTPDPKAIPLGSVITSNGTQYTYGNIIQSGVIGDFSSVTGSEGSDDITDNICGKYSFGSSHDWVNKGWSWTVCKNTTGILAPAITGFSIDASGMDVVATGNNPNNVFIGLIDSDGTYSDKNLYLLTDSPNYDSPEQVTVASSYVPSSIDFISHIVASFDNQYNINVVTPINVNIISPFVHVGDNTSNNFHKDSTNEYVVVYMKGYNIPIISSTSIANSTSTYIAPFDTSRKTTVHVLQNPGEYIDNIDINGSYVFPNISIGKWINDNTDSKLIPIKYRAFIGWGTTTAPSITTAMATIMAYGQTDWLKELYKRTYLYITYGIHSIDTSLISGDTFLDNIDGNYSTYGTAAHMRFLYHTIASVSSVSGIAFMATAFP